MATLKDSVVQGSLRATDSLLATTGQFKILNAPTSAGGTTYGPGTNGYVLRSNGSSAYWGSFAASDVPNHSTDKLTSGTLPVSRGGTGITTSTTKNAVIVGNSSTVTNAFQAIQTKNGAFYATATDGAPSFGTLPIAQGGTGKTNANDAIANLGGVKKAGDTMTGTLTVKGLKGTSGTDYGTSLPASPAEGQMFFQISDPWYELPAGGSAGQVLMKKTNTNYDVAWGTVAAASNSLDFDQIYPIGSIYMNIGLVDPSSLFGGTWTRLEDKFLLAAGTTYPGNSSGGSAVLTDVPYHRHSTPRLYGNADYGGQHGHTGYYRSTGGYGDQNMLTGSGGSGASGTSDNVAAYGGAHSHGAYVNASNTDYTGVSGGVSILPPYITVYVWQRTA